MDKNPKEVGRENVRHKNLKKGASKTECSDFHVPDEPGERFNVRAYVKFDGNKSYSTPIIFEVKGLVKLELYELRLLDREGNEADSLDVGELFIAEARVKNSGYDLDQDVKVSFSIFDQSDRLIASGLENIRSYNLEEGEKKRETHSFQIDVPGQYVLEVCADPENKISEKNEADNCLELDFQIVP